MQPVLQCTCGNVQGEFRSIEKTNRGICYCRDCQAFAHFLGKPDQILDKQGGTDVIQTMPDNIRFTEGTDKLACMRLRSNGLIRWYSRCCQTPIANTPANYKLPYVGVVHNCLEQDQAASLDSVFGPVKACVNTQSAWGHPKPAGHGFLSTLFRVGIWVLRSRLTDGYRQTPFFEVETGRPIVKPNVLSPSELSGLMAQIKGSESG